MDNMNNNVLSTCGNSGIGSSRIVALAISNQIFFLTRFGNVGASLENLEYL